MDDTFLTMPTPSKKEEGWDVLVPEAVRPAFEKWCAEGRTDEQIYGVRNFLTGAGANSMMCAFFDGEEAGKEKLLTHLISEVEKMLVERPPESEIKEMTAVRGAHIDGCTVGLQNALSLLKSNLPK